jgi:hypothetical protein
MRGLDEDEEGDEDIEEIYSDYSDEEMAVPDGYGVRLPRNQTNWQQRTTDALHPEGMRAAQTLFDASATLNLVSQWYAFMISWTSAFAPSLTYLHRVISLCFMMAQFQALCYYHDWQDYYYYPLTNRERPPDRDRFSPLQFRTIDDMSDINSEAEIMTGFTQANLRILMRKWRIPRVRHLCPYFAR